MKRVIRIAKWTVMVLAALFLAIQFVRPARINPPVDESQTIFARTGMPPQGAAIFDRACRDCHSNKTDWPWYSNVAPISWWLTNHVNTGRSLLNLSEWGRLDPDRQDRKLRQICDQIQDGAMPLPSYTPMHPNAKLSAEDIKAICDWTDDQRARLSDAPK